MIKRYRAGCVMPSLDVCLASDVARLEQAHRESVARGLEHAAIVQDMCAWRDGSTAARLMRVDMRAAAARHLRDAARHKRHARRFHHWSQAARAGRLDWAIREAMGKS